MKKGSWVKVADAKHKDFEKIGIINGVTGDNWLVSFWTKPIHFDEKVTEFEPKQLEDIEIPKEFQKKDKSKKRKP